MKLFLSLIVCLVFSFGYSQNIKIEGYCYYLSVNDTVKECTQLTSQKIFTPDGEMIYERIIPFGETIETEFKETIYGDTTIYRTWRNNNLAETIYFEDTIRKQDYTIQKGRDTTILQLFYKDEKIVKDSNINSYSVRLFSFNESGLLDTITHLGSYGNKYYITYEYDEKKRLTLYKMHTKPNRADTSYAYTNITYFDTENKEVKINGNNDWLDYKQTVITYFNENKIPIKKEFIYYDYGVTSHYKVKYEVVEKFSTE